MTQDYRLVSQKTISGKATLKLNLSEGDKARSLVVYSRVVRFPSTDYLNKRYEPNRSRYGNLIFLRDDFVLTYFPIEFAKQRFNFVQDSSGEVQLQIACITQEILQSFANLAVALGAVPITIQNETKDWKTLDFSPDTLQVVVENNAALDVAIYVLDYDECEEIEEPRPEPKEPPPPPPPKRPPVAPGEPIEVDPPEETDDEDSYSPNPIDEIDNPGEGIECSVYVVVVRVIWVPGQFANAFTDFSATLYGEIGVASVLPGTPKAIQVESRGVVTGSSTCGDFVPTTIATTTANIQSLSILSITESP